MRLFLPAKGWHVCLKQPLEEADDFGEVFDNVYVEGGTQAQHNVQTTLIPAGGSSIVEFGVENAGDLILVDHSIFRAFNKGTLGMIARHFHWI